jgi:hypothetical protein
LLAFHDQSKRTQRIDAYQSSTTPAAWRQRQVEQLTLAPNSRQQELLGQLRQTVVLLASLRL